MDGSSASWWRELGLRDKNTGFSLCSYAVTEAPTVPTRSILHPTRSPALIRAPFGHPVEIRSPGYSVMYWL